MFKKSDVLPAILAVVSTAILIALGFAWFNKINARNAENSEGIGTSVVRTTTTDRNSTTTQTIFLPPNIVPQGTSVRINGSTRMIQVNLALKKSFQRRFPGTAVITNADGSDTGLELLRTGEIDIAAILRPLTQTEKKEGFAAVTVDELVSEVDNQVVQNMLYYVYQEPANIEVEAFLGFALSAKGQSAIVNR